MYLWMWHLVIVWLLFLHVFSMALQVQRRSTWVKDSTIQDNDDLAAFGVHERDEHVVLNNGIVSVTLTAPGGLITNITYKGSKSLLETQNKENDRGYWDLVWNKPGDHGIMDKLVGTSYKVIVQNRNQTEISFSSKWTFGSAKVPLNVDKRFVMLRDSPGFYTYIVLERLKEWPTFNIQEGRIAFKLHRNIFRLFLAFAPLHLCPELKAFEFHFMAMSDERQRVMPLPQDRIAGHALDYPEAVLLTSPANPELKGEVDDKYLYSCDNKDNKVHGWVSNDASVGVWMITPSNEFRSGGPFKQDLTSHVGPTMLSMFISRHYAGEDVDLKFENGEYWKKVLGPVYVYLNSHDQHQSTTNTTTINPSLILWNDAKKRMEQEVSSWPYSFPLSSDFVKSNRRGALIGQLLVHERLIHRQAAMGASAYIGLAPPGQAGSWQTESKGYQFWTQTDRNGNFLIKNVVPGKYSLFAWVPGKIGDYKHPKDIVITPGSTVKTSKLVFKPPRRGATLWEIGIPDRTAAEFFIPDPNPAYKIHQYKNNATVEKFRQYGLWSRYTDLYPKNDLVFTIGQNDYRKDWFFAHVNREFGNKQFEATTWQIVFQLGTFHKTANYTLQLALASANGAELQVRFNDANLPPLFTTGLVGRDNALARHGIHGLYHLYNVEVSGTRLVRGKNKVFLTQARNTSTFSEVMYDYIRFEGPA